MKKTPLLIAVGALLICVRTSEAQSIPTSALRTTAQTTSARSLEPDSGTVSGNVYRNWFFGLAYRFPSEWQVMRSNHSVPGTQPGEGSVYQLLFVSEPHNLFQISVIVIQAVKLPSATTAQAYLVSQYAAIKRSHFKRQGDPQLVKLGGRDFWAVTATSRVSGHTLREDFLVAIVKDYALKIDLISNTEATYNMLKATLQSISFGSTDISNPFSRESPNSPTGTSGVTQKEKILESGRISGARYTNSFLGLTYELPAGLAVENQARIQQVAQTGHELIYGDNPDTDVEHIEAMKEAIFLVAGVAPGPKPHSAPTQAIVIAGDVSAYPGMTARQLMVQLDFSMQSNPAYLQPTGRVSEKRYGSTRFARADFAGRFRVRGQRIPIYMTFLVTVSRGYAVTWMFSASSKNRMKTLIDSLSSVILQAGAPAPQ